MRFQSGTFRPRVRHLAFVVPLLIAGCVTTELQYKAGITPAQRNRDVAACEKQATRAAPVDNTYSVTPRRWVPAQQHCNSHGCSYRGGYWTGGNVVATDQNTYFRAQAYGRCMAAKGYQSVAATGCTGKVREALLKSPQGRYPRLTADSCTVGMSDGTLKVHTP